MMRRASPMRFRRSERAVQLPAPLVFASALLLIVAIGLLPGEFGHYKRWLELASDETALRVAVLSVVLSKTLAVVVVFVVFLALVRRWVGSSTLRILSIVFTVALFGFLEIDLAAQKITGNNVADYLPYLFDPESMRWAGRGFDATPLFWSIVKRLVTAIAAAGLLAWGLERWVGRARKSRARRVVASLVGLALIGLAATPLMLQAGVAPGPLDHLGEKMPWSVHGRLGAVDGHLRDPQRAVEGIYARALPRWSQAASSRGAERPADVQPKRRPDILLIVVESFRHDALDQETMPNLWALSESSKEGARFPTHYATSNASHYGMFALLFGRSPLAYFEALEGGESPTLPSKLREWGYDNHFVSCSDIAWRGMERFIGPPHFAVERLRAIPLSACDRQVASRATALLEEKARPPRFVLAFMMSTHFGYHYPPESSPFHPALAAPNALDLVDAADRAALLNRYRNSAHYIDDLIKGMLAGLDSSRTLVVVTGDHGESIFDDGTVAHSSRLSEIQTRVPLVLAGPGVAARPRLAGPTDHADLLPTLLGRLGVEPGEVAERRGADLLSTGQREFVPLIHAKARRGGRDRIALVSGDERYSLRLDARAGRAEFLGKLNADGRPSRTRVSPREGATAARWFEDYLRSMPNEAKSVIRFFRPTPTD